MRSAFLVLVCALALATATRVPPFTYANYWDQFHVQGGCFNDVYLYDEDLDDDAAIHYITRVLIIPDFSYPYVDDLSYLDAYDAEIKTLDTFATELSSMAFPISIFETCDPAAGFDEYQSLQVSSLWYDVVYGDGDYYTACYLNDPTKGSTCLSNLITDIQLPYTKLQHDISSNGDQIWIAYYNAPSYTSGLGSMIHDYLTDPNIGKCKPDEFCYALLTRVNPDAFADADGMLAQAVMELKVYGYQVITLDNQWYKTESVATWSVSEPQERFAHLLTSPISPRPEFLGTKLVQAIRGGNSACLSYGMHQVLTYDGYGYTQNDLGDFVLAKDLYAGTFEVQIRNNPCDRSSNVHNVACTDGLAIRVGTRTIAFYYDRMDDLLAVTVNGELARPGYLSFAEFNAFVIRKYPAGYEVGVYTSLKTFDRTPFTYIRAEFLFTGSVAVYPAPSLRYGMGGLCGTFDGCALDEFYTVDEKFVADQAYFVESWRAHGGASLFEQPSYMLTAPFVAHPPFVDNAWTTWQYDPAQNTAEALGYCAGYMAGALYDTCLYLYQLSYTIPTSDLNMILAMFPQNTRLSDLALWDPLAPVCADSCENSYSRMGGFNMIDVNCSTICDSQMADQEGIYFQFPDTTTATYKVKIPVANSHYGRQAFFVAPLGGDYLVRVRSFDCCTESDNVDFIVSVDCTSRQVLVKIPTEVVNIFIDEFALPVVELMAVLEDNSNPNVHIMWSFLSTPDWNIPELMNPFNAYPSFIPQAMGNYTLQVIATDGCSVSADTVIVTIHCYNRDYVLNSFQSDSMVYTHTQNWYNNIFSKSWLYLDKSCLAPIGATIASQFTEFPWTFAPVAWTKTVTHVPVAPYTAATDPLKMRIVQDDGVWKNYIVYWQIDEDVFTGPINLDVDDTNRYLLGTQSIVPQREAISLHKYGVIRAEARIVIDEYQTRQVQHIQGTYYIKAHIRSDECKIFTYLDFEAQVDGTYKSKLSIWAQNEYVDPAVVYDTLHNNYLSFGYDWIANKYYDWLLAQNPDGSFVYADVMPFIYDNFHFHTGHCPGQYLITVDLDDTFACPTTSGHDQYLLDATCIRRPQPLPIIPCYELTFDYAINSQVGAYPTAFMLGYDTVVPAYRDMDFAWYLYQWINGTLGSMAYVNLNAIDLTQVAPVTWAGTWSNWQMENITYSQPFLDWKLNRPANLPKPYQSAPDIYWAFLYATDHCMNRYEFVEVIWHCRPPPNMNFVINQTPVVPIAIPTTTTLEYNGNASYPPRTAWWYGALRTSMACTCIEPPSVTGLPQINDYFTLFNIPHCSCPPKSLLPADEGVFVGTAQWPATYTLRLRVDDQCTWNTIDTSMTAACDSVGGYNNFVFGTAWTVTDEIATTTNRASGYTYAITNRPADWLDSNGNPHQLIFNALGTTVGWWCDYDDVANQWILSSCVAALAGAATWTIDYHTRGYSIAYLTSTRFHKVLITYNKCLYALNHYYVTYTCSPGNIPNTLPAWTISSGYQTIYGYNNSAYDITLRTTVNFGDATTWGNIHCVLHWRATSTNSKCNYTVSYGASNVGGCMPTLSDGSNGYLMHLSLSGCPNDNVNNIEIWTEYWDGVNCAMKPSTHVTINVRCRWDLQINAAVSSTMLNTATVSWLNGEFPTVCVGVPDTPTNFIWTKPWDSTFNAGDPFMGCNFESCLVDWTWMFGVTPELSVFQTKTVNYTVAAPSAVVTVDPFAYTDCLLYNKTGYSWLNDTTDCGAGFMLNYQYQQTLSTQFERDMSTFLVSEGAADLNRVAYADQELVNPYLAGCFRPDVAGDYDLTLTVHDTCLFRDAVSSVTVTADCGAAPTVQVVDPGVGDVVMGTRYPFQVQVTDANDNMHAYEWSLWYCENSVVEDITVYLTNAHAKDTSFIPIAQGCHHWKLVVYDDCVRADGTSYTVQEGTFNVVCRTSSAPVLPLPPTSTDGGVIELLYSVVDFNGQGMLPIHEYVVNTLKDQVVFNWKIAGFTPRYATWEDVYPVASDILTSHSILVPPGLDKNVHENFGTTTTPALILLAILSLFLLF